ncbi:hypothetical protein A2Z67_00065 [Candidatus Woesebacteria bacterium RBG_13_36_22]|uniref:Methyltransferase n=1 Tax=Candidatus Woesebacteria bacterium RBG_13_36_22 TaxID=1802478 RepID=A0A1F7X8I1_9BACT|nr:MAG: hypothetical protein A2Z67_00065 [Candidatus Woesebacteria bacterium RBG_13_36_22]
MKLDPCMLDWTFRYIFDNQIQSLTTVSIESCHVIWQLAKHSCRIPGDVAELGVYGGGAAKLLCFAYSGVGKEIHLFDTFSGIPALMDKEKGDEREGPIRDFSVSIQDVKKHLSNFRKKIHFHKGVFPKTLTARIEKMEFCLVHIDASIYFSAKAGCEFFYPRLSSGGALIINDYGFSEYSGVKRSVDEYFENRKGCIKLFLGTGQFVVVRD